MAEGNDGGIEMIAEVEAELAKQVVVEEAGMAKEMKSIDKRLRGDVLPSHPACFNVFGKARLVLLHGASPVQRAQHPSASALRHMTTGRLFGRAGAAMTSARHEAFPT